jgi:hypothetical protein
MDLEIQNVTMWIGFSWIATVGGSCEHGNEPSV